MNRRIVWSDSALDDLRAIRSGLGEEAAKRVGRVIAESADCLDEFPERGRLGSVEGLRELPLPGLPWRLTYRLFSDGGVAVLRVLRG
jgi:toxin ParE1/3/4